VPPNRTWIRYSKIGMRMSPSTAIDVVTALCKPLSWQFSLREGIRSCWAEPTAQRVRILRWRVRYGARSGIEAAGRPTFEALLAL
jgi:hypothetical protein